MDVQTAEIVKPLVQRNRNVKTGAAATIRKLKLRHPELSQADIAKRVGCSEANVSKVLQRFLSDEFTRADLGEFQESKADNYDSLQLRFLSSITHADIVKAPLLARVTASAILEDKARTIRGQATQINVNVLLDAVQAVRDMRRRPDVNPL